MGVGPLKKGIGLSTKMLWFAVALVLLVALGVLWWLRPIVVSSDEADDDIIELSSVAMASTRLAETEAVATGLSEHLTEIIDSTRAKFDEVIESKREAVNEANQNYQDTQSKLSAKQGEVNSMQQQLNGLTADKTSLNSDLVARNRSLTKAREDLAEMQVTDQERELEMVQFIETESNRIQEMRNVLGQANQEIQESEQAMDSIADKLNDFLGDTAGNNIPSDSLAKLNELWAAEQKKIRDLESAVAQLQQVAETEETELEKALKQVQADKDAMMADMKSTAAVQQQVLASQQSGLAALATQYEGMGDVQQSYAELVKENESLSKRLEAKRPSWVPVLIAPPIAPPPG